VNGIGGGRGNGIKEAAEQHFLLRRPAMSKAKDRLSNMPATPVFEPKLEQ
jgi:hypothetical protein